VKAFVAPLPFACEIRSDGDLTILELTGELDLAQAPALAGAITEVLETGCRRLIVDLRGLSFLDASGLQALLTANRSARARGGQVSLVPGCFQVQRLFELTGADSRFTFVDPAATR
jgi:anti-sigma B factor antagonist